MKRLFQSIAVALCLTGVAVAAAPPQEMPKSYLLSGPGRVTPLHAGVTYQASLFPIPVRLTPAAGWSGAQWKSTSAYFSDTGGPPYFGWVALAGGSPRAIPQGLVTILTAYARTPSVAATADLLRTRGRGASYEPAAPVKIAGYSGVQFDGKITGAKNAEHVGHIFVPFSPPSSAAKYYPDEYPVYGDAFRVLVLDVRGKTVVAIVENVALPVGQFPAFLAKADRLLQSLRFPA
jgi:hypothetical protein